MWIAAAIGSAFFAGITAILSKCGVKSANSDAATAVRTSVVLAMAWGIALLTGACAQLPAVSARSWIFLILSGLATGASWLCYYYAIQNGQVSVVVPIDRLSILVTVLFSLAVFREKLSAKGWIGLALLTAGTVCMANTGRPVQTALQIRDILCKEGRGRSRALLSVLHLHFERPPWSALRCAAFRRRRRNPKPAAKLPKWSDLPCRPARI